MIMVRCVLQRIDRKLYACVRTSFAVWVCVVSIHFFRCVTSKQTRWKRGKFPNRTDLEEKKIRQNVFRNNVCCNSGLSRFRWWYSNDVNSPFSGYDLRFMRKHKTIYFMMVPFFQVILWNWHKKLYNFLEFIEP